MRRFDRSVMGALVLAVALGGWACECQNGGSSQARLGPTPLQVDEGDDPCPHPYMPLLKGASWTYEITSALGKAPVKAELSVTSVAAKGRSITAEVRKAVGARETVVEAFCNADGVSFLPLFVELGPPLPTTLNYVPTVTKRVNALLSPVSKLRLGAQWTHSVTAHTERPGGKALTLDSMWEVEVSYLGEEPVTVPAGSYTAKQVKMVISGHHRPPAEEEVVFSPRMADPPPMTFTYSLAEGVGVVQIKADPLEDRPNLRPQWVLTKVALER